MGGFPRAVIVKGYDSVVTRCSGSHDPTFNGGGKHPSTVIVYVLTDEVNPAGRRGDYGRRRLIVFSEFINLF